MSDDLSPGQKEELSRRALECLNSAFKADPDAITTLMANGVHGNQALLDHPHVTINEFPTFGTVGAIGLVNGILAAMGIPDIASAWGHPDSIGRRRLVGFVACDLE